MQRTTRSMISFGLFVIVICLSLLLGNSGEVFNNISEQNPIYRVNVEEKKISLTFDINWAEKEYIYEILDILEKYNVKATFFIMGKWVNYTEENLEKLKMIKDDGHEIGNHSYVHPDFRNISKDRIREEIEKTSSIIEKAIGIAPKLFRFPSGEYNKSSVDVVNELGYKSIQWDCDSGDWMEKGLEYEYQRIMKNLKPGSIMLFHNNAKYTPENVERIINELKKEGYEFVPVGELIYDKDYYIDENGEQRKINN